MKTLFSSFRFKPLLFASMLLGLFFVTSCDKDDNDEPDNRPYTISGNASGSQVVPAVSGTGTATITGTYNPEDRSLTYTSNWSGLTGMPTSGGFYNGASGSSGTLIGTAWSLPTDASGTGSYNGTITLTPEEANQLTAGNWYYSYGTTANPSGEVRGQITATR